MQNSDPVVIVAAKRTPIGNFQGVFQNMTAPALGGFAIQGALAASGLKPDDISEVTMGCVLSAGIGQAPARQAALAAKLPLSCGATTINKMCGSGMKAVMIARDYLLQNETDIVIAGGMESMTNAPYILPKARAGMRLGHSTCLDHLFFDGLEDAYDKGKLMGYFAEVTAKEYNLSRTQQDEFALLSLSRAKQANEKGLFSDEIIPVTTPGKNSAIISADETPFKSDPAKIPTLKPAFQENGTVTAANSSSISDGAAALVLMRRSTAVRRGLKPLAIIVAQATHAQEPNWFTTAPIGAINKVLAKAHWEVGQVDLFEVNEAFAVVTMVAMQNLSIPIEKMNIRGGACALGHPIGASGARILTTLLHSLQQTKHKRGVAALCIGGGEATAMAIELCS